MKAASKLIYMIFAYLLGTVNLSYILARKELGLDLRRSGSGNLGASNLAVHLGKGKAAMAFFADCAEEAAALLVARALGWSEAWQAAAGLAVIAGHNWPFYLRFQGGRGMAMALTGTLILLPYEGLVLVGFLTLGVFSRHTAEMNLLALFLVPVLAWRWGRPAAFIAFTLGVLAFALLRRAQGSPEVGKKKLREDPRKVLWSRIIYDREAD
ncbi:glycerol-3-phosphate acyltransferase [Candidatus Solincola tengchongensis]|uniref:glycerol-3-phosphate acyltransferase n=1 Tax=Candidatus Solincola tengchongensis TaxID=2900693 RepID=UPI00257A5F3D|nr:glycerol-3-phosphate acyltransferase [Candidatus Solincola tengchongensis]